MIGQPFARILRLMDILWFGQACFKLKGKGASVVIDPYSPEFTGLKAPRNLEADVVAITHSHQDHNNTSLVVGEPVVINGPGEYEVKGVSITGISTFHDSVRGEERGKNTVYNITIDGMNVVHLGDLGQTLSDEIVADIGSTDILLIPVGGVYTIDAKMATDVVSSLEPRIIIPMHYKIEGLKFNLDPLENFLKEMGVEGVQPIQKLTITKDKLPEEPQVMVLSKS